MQQEQAVENHSTRTKVLSAFCALLLLSLVLLAWHSNGLQDTINSLSSSLSSAMQSLSTQKAITNTTAGDLQNRTTELNSQKLKNQKLSAILNTENNTLADKNGRLSALGFDLNISMANLSLMGKELRNKTMTISNLSLEMYSLNQSIVNLHQNLSLKSNALNASTAKVNLLSASLNESLSNIFILLHLKSLMSEALNASQANMTAILNKYTLLLEKLNESLNESLLNITVVLDKCAGLSAELNSSNLNMTYILELKNLMSEALNFSLSNLSALLDKYALLSEKYNETNVHDPTYAELTAFLANDMTEHHTYTDPTYVCMNFAADLKANATGAGIRCGFIVMNFITVGHAINVFNTTDQGLIFIDQTNNGDGFVPEPMVGQQWEPYPGAIAAGWTSEPIQDVVIAW